MIFFIAGLIVFLGIHLVPAFPALRARLASRLGEGPYKGLFSLVSALGLGLIIFGYGRAQADPNLAWVWFPPYWTRHLTFLLMLPVFPLLIEANLPGTLKKWLPNPMLTAIKLWAVAHLITKGTLPAVMLYLAFLAWAVIDVISVKQRQRAGLVKVRTGPVSNDVISFAIGLAIYVVFLYWGHEKLIGTPVLPANWPR
ncbi:MAG: NnrU family protein [Hyphomicrobiaceae bacterium]|nr:MAG: NnrU family protein [Hyphomicrobiaceae bacterium]